MCPHDMDVIAGNSRNAMRAKRCKISGYGDRVSVTFPSGMVKVYEVRDRLVYDVTDHMPYLICDPRREILAPLKHNARIGLRHTISDRITYLRNRFGTAIAL